MLIVHDTDPEPESPSQKWVPKTAESKTPAPAKQTNDIAKQLDVPIESLEVAVDFDNPVSTQGKIAVAPAPSNRRVPPPEKLQQRTSLPPIVTNRQQRASLLSKDMSPTSSRKKRAIEHQTPTKPRLQEVLNRDISHFSGDPVNQSALLLGSPKTTSLPISNNHFMQRRYSTSLASQAN